MMALHSFRSFATFLLCCGMDGIDIPEKTCAGCTITREMATLERIRSVVLWTLRIGANSNEVHKLPVEGVEGKGGRWVC